MGHERAGQQRKMGNGRAEREGAKRNVDCVTGNSNIR